MKIAELLSQAESTPSFARIHEAFSQANIQNWLLEEEKKLLFAIGAFAPGNGIVVEIGSFQGGSASFLSSGIAERGRGRLFCLDPHLGAPPWLGVAPHQSTLSIFLLKLRLVGVDNWVSPRVGESSAVAGVWPAIPVDAVFIDGDHSFLGALRDFETWFPKVSAGGLVIIDDADDPVLTELLDFIEFVKTLSCVSYQGTVQGMAVFERTSVDAWDGLANLAKACESRGLYRPWDYTSLHGLRLPGNYMASRSWTNDHGLDIAYQLCFMARCGPGRYGFTEQTSQNDREVFYTLMRDRRDGELTAIGKNSEKSHDYRSILCSPSEAIECAPLLMPGGVLIARETDRDSIATRNILLKAGLEGCGYDSGIQWGIWRPSYLSAEAVINYSVRAYKG